MIVIKGVGREHQRLPFLQSGLIWPGNGSVVLLCCIFDNVRSRGNERLRFVTNSQPSNKPGQSPANRTEMITEMRVKDQGMMAPRPSHAHADSGEKFGVSYAILMAPEYILSQYSNTSGGSC